MIDKEVIAKICSQFHTPIFIISEKKLFSQVQKLKKAFYGLNLDILYAIKANYNPYIIKALREAGIDGIDAVSPFEFEYAKWLGFTENEILFTANNSSIAELQSIMKYKAKINIGSLSEVKKLSMLIRNQKNTQNNNNANAPTNHQNTAHSALASEIKVVLRLNPGIGEGEYAGTTTGGKSSKFGILESDLPEAIKLLKLSGIKLYGIHCHIGSGIYHTEKFGQVVDFLFRIKNEYCQDIQFIDFGGGFGVAYRPQDNEIDINACGKILIEKTKKWNIDNKKIKFAIEPGKFLVAESTYFLMKVTNISFNNGEKIVAVDSGMNHILRHALYSANHHVENFTKSAHSLNTPPANQIDKKIIVNDNLNAKNKNNMIKEKIRLVGNICESTDKFYDELEIDETQEGDLLLMHATGAYCASMSSLYNMRPYASEVIVMHNNDFKLTRKSEENFSDFIKIFHYL